MNTILLLFCAIVAVPTGLADGAKNYSLQNKTNSLQGRNKYVNLIREEFSKVLSNYYTQLQVFEKLYLGRLEGIFVQTDVITATIKHAEHLLSPLEFLSDSSKKCVSRYRSQIPKVTTTQKEIRQCLTEAASQVAVLSQNARNTRNDFKYHFENKFEQKIKLCEDKFANKTHKYDVCLQRKIAKSNAIIVQSKKTFGIQIKAAECTARANIKRAFDCSYTVRKKTIYDVARVNLAINSCLEGEEVCEPCFDYSCPDTLLWKLNEQNRTILNPFYGKTKQPDCLMLKLEQN